MVVSTEFRNASGRLMRLNALPVPRRVRVEEEMLRLQGGRIDGRPPFMQQVIGMLRTRCVPASARRDAPSLLSVQGFSGMVRIFSSVSTTNTARSFAGSVLLALALTSC